MKFEINAMFKQSAVFFLYLGFLLILYASVLRESGQANIGDLASYLLALIVAFSAFSMLLQKPQRINLTSNVGTEGFLDMLAQVLLAVAVAFVVGHIVWLGEVPLLTAARINDYYDVMRVRQGIFYNEVSFFRYAPNLVIKSLFPFLILYFYLTKRPSEFWWTVIIACLYGAVLMNKMFIVIPLFPVIVYLLMNRKPLAAAKMALLPIALLVVLVLVQNPHIRPEIWTPRSQATAAGKPLIIERSPYRIAESAFPALQFVETIYIRSFIIPGQVVTAWFRNIPEHVPYANGCGYRWAARILDCEFRFVPQLIHDIENPNLVAEGIKGTMTAANFMEDYANFGRWGLIGSGIVMGLLLSVIGAIYKNNWRSAILLNLIPVAMLMELPLSTILLTGGWALTTLLYLLFGTRINGSDLVKKS